MEGNIESQGNTNEEEINFEENTDDFCIDYSITDVINCVTEDDIQNFQENISQRLKTLRETYNLTQAQLARKLVLSQSAIAKYETGFSIPSLEAMLKYAICFNVSLDYLVTRPKCNYPDHSGPFPCIRTDDLKERLVLKIIQKRKDEYIKQSLK